MHRIPKSAMIYTTSYDLKPLIFTHVTWYKIRGKYAGNSNKVENKMFLALIYPRSKGKYLPMLNIKD